MNKNANEGLFVISIKTSKGRLLFIKIRGAGPTHYVLGPKVINISRFFKIFKYQLNIIFLVQQHKISIGFNFIG